MQLPKGKLLDVRDYKVKDEIAQDENSFDLEKFIRNDSLIWEPIQGIWKVAISTLSSYQSFYLNEASTDLFLENAKLVVQTGVTENFSHHTNEAQCSLVAHFIIDTVCIFSRW